MKLSILSALLSLVSAAPYVSHNAHHNRAIHRRQPLLHEDLVALLQVAATTTSATVAPSATATTEPAHGPYAAGEAHGGNPYAVVSVSESATASGTASAVDSAEMAGATGNDWTIAAAPRPARIYSHDYDNSTEAVLSESDVNDDDDSTTSNGSSVPTWAIVLTTIICVLLLGSLVAFAVIKYKQRGAHKGSEEKVVVNKSDPEDALTSYKAFWEQKRQSAGSFVSADANPAALASSLLATTMEGHEGLLPQYREHESTLGGSNTSTPIMTPTSERAPPHGFLPQ